MSTLLDSLRRARYADTAAPHAPGAGRQVELILSTLGYARPRRRRGALRLAVGVVAVASIALLGWMMGERSASIPSGTQVAADASTDDPGSRIAGPGTDDVPRRARRPVKGGDLVPARAPDPVADTAPPLPAGR